MKRLITLAVALVAMAAALGVTARSAEAAATCTTHYSAISSWSESNDWVRYESDFKCGGAAPTGYLLHIILQYDAGGGSWHPVACNSTGVCETWKPGGSYYPAGSENTPSGQFNVNGQIDGVSMRIHVVVEFANGDPDVPFNSSAVTV